MTLFPTNPINALEASQSDSAHFTSCQAFPTNPINALEARVGLELGGGVLGSFQLIQLTHWKRAAPGVTGGNTRAVSN